jgi:hypothetical protein
MEAVQISETLLNSYKSTPRRYKPEDSHLYNVTIFFMFDETDKDVFYSGTNHPTFGIF